MYRILIVDDEPFIVNNINLLLNEAGHWDLEAYRAYNVYEALDCLAHNRIDVVISDIRMPGMSGIELHERIIESWPMCKVIFLTGFNEFDYARNAIRMGGIVDYVLKTEDDHVLLAALNKAIDELDKAEERINHDIKARTKLQSAIAAIQKSTLFKLMAEPALSVKEREHKLLESDISLLSNKQVFVVIGSIEGWNGEVSEADRMLLLYACQNIAEEYLATTCIQLSVTFDLNKIVWLIQPIALRSGEQTEGEQEHRAWQHLKTRVYSIMESVQQSCIQLYKYPVSFVIGKEPCSWEDIGGQFDHLKKLLAQYAGQGQEMLIQDSDKLSSLYESVRGEQTERLIHFIQQYVKTNLDGDLSLTALATLVHHSPTYLSRLYKRTTGAMLSDYITNERMKKAKDLLEDTTMKIQEIAITSGYEAPSQFNRSFKRIFQMTPQEYRENFLIERQLKRTANAKKGKYC